MNNETHSKITSIERPRPLVTVIVPAFNEEECIADCLNDALYYLSRQSYGWEILVIDDGSLDQTANIAKSISTRHELDIFISVHRSNRGLGAAFITGLKNARGRYAFLHPADRSYRIDDLERFLKKLDDGDFVMGRRERYQQTHGSLRSRISEWYSAVFSPLFEIDLHDYSGVSLVPVDAVRLDLPRLPRLATIETPALLAKSGLRPVIMPLQCFPRMAGTSKIASISVYAKAALELVWLWYRLKFIRPASGSRPPIQAS